MVDRFETGDYLPIFHQNLKLVLFEKTLKLKYFFARKNIFSKNDVSRALLLFNYLSCDSQTCMKQGESNVNNVFYSLLIRFKRTKSNI